MRLANLAGRAALVLDDGVLDVEESTQGAFSADPLESIERAAELARLAPLLEGVLRPLDRDLLGPPSPRPGQIIAIGMNYHSHAEEMGLELPTVPAAFAKFRSSLGGPVGEISLPVLASR